MATTLPQQTIDNLVLDAEAFGKFIIGLLSETVVTRTAAQYPTLARLIQDIAAAGGYQPFDTTSELTAATPDVEKQLAKALDTGKVWAWQRTSLAGTQPVTGVWRDTGLSEKDQAIAYTQDKFIALAETLAPLCVSSATDAIPILIDAANKKLVWYDTVADRFKAVGLVEQVIELIPNVWQTSDASKLAALTDAAGNILLGYDTVDDKPIIAGLDLLQSSIRRITGLNHLLGYGQSLSVGATATVILSTAQPYLNKTFNTSPRMDTPASSLMPLVEQFNNPSSDGATNRGETICSGAANYASRMMQLQLGIAPNNHKIFASTAGHGGYRLDQLQKGTAWYEFLRNHIITANRLAGEADETYQVQVIAWEQGENDALTTVQTPLAVYKPALLQLSHDITADARAITGQSDQVLFVTYQLSYAAKTWSDQAIAQLELVQEQPHFGLSTPMYHMPYHTDNIHLTNVGYKWLGAYVGRAYTQFVVENKKPDYINPRVATIDATTVTITFDVPTLPLVLDSTTLAATKDSGFAVRKNGVEVAILSVQVSDGNKITITTGVNLTDGSVEVRYALDNLGAGINLTGGASGNLRDSTQDTAVIAGETKPLYHVCPHFKLTANIDRGI